MFDFPASPTLGQQYTSGGVTYIWNGQAWAGGPIASAGTKVSMLQTPPASPASGDLWWETDTGYLWLYYDDGTSAQWVQVNYSPPNDVLQKYARLTAQRNMVFNSDFGMSQLGQGQFAVQTVNQSYFADGWQFSFAGGAVSGQDVGPATSGGPLQKGRNRGQLKTTTAKTTLAAGDIFQCFHSIEGVDLAPLKWGTADAIPALVRFGFRGPAGTYGVSLSNNAADRSWVGTFTIAAGEANTDKVVVLSIPAKTDGTWPNSTTQGGSLRFNFASGTTWQGAAGWNNGNFCTTSAQFNGLGTVGNTFEIFDVKLIPDPDSLGASFDPGFQPLIYADEMVRCFRYWQVMTITFIRYGAAGAAARENFFLPVNMRATPTIALNGSLGTLTNCSGLTMNPLGNNAAYANVTVTALGNATVAGTTYTFDATL